MYSLKVKVLRETKKVSKNGSHQCQSSFKPNSNLKKSSAEAKWQDRSPATSMPDYPSNNTLIWRSSVAAL